MSRADIEILRAAYEAVNRGDWDAAFSGMHPDFEWKTEEGLPTSETTRGPDEFRRFYDDRTMAFDEVVVEPEQFFERGDQIVVFVLMRFRPRGSNAAPEIRIAHLWTMRDGKAARCELFPQREKALEAVGLSQQSLIRAGYKSWSDGDLEAFLETLDPEIELLTSGSFPDFPAAYRGYDGMRSFWESIRAPWGRFQLDVERIVEGDD